MMKTVRVMERSYNSMLPYGKLKLDGKMTQEDKRAEELKRMSHISYVTRSQLQYVKSDELLTPVWEGA